MSQANHQSKLGATALVTAVLNGQCQMVTLLVSLGAQLERKSRGRTALWHSVNIGDVTIAEELLRLGAVANKKVLRKAMRRPLVLRALLKEQTGRVVVPNRDILRWLKRALKRYIKALIHKHSDASIGRCVAAVREMIPKVVLERAKDFKLLRCFTLLEAMFLIPKNRVATKLIMQHLSHCCDVTSNFWRLPVWLRAWSHRHRHWCSVQEAEVEIERFWRLTILTSDNPQRLRRRIIMHLWMYRNDVEFQADVSKVVAIAERLLSTPLSLQDLCVVRTRRCFRGRLWEQIDKLPVPNLLKDMLKLIKY